MFDSITTSTLISTGAVFAAALTGVLVVVAGYKVFFRLADWVLAKLGR
jgi:preprotein translocase subunit SecE